MQFFPITFVVTCRALSCCDRTVLDTRRQHSAYSNLLSIPRSGLAGPTGGYRSRVKWMPTCADNFQTTKGVKEYEFTLRASSEYFRLDRAHGALNRMQEEFYLPNQLTEKALKQNDRPLIE
ncbi:unnamed protein product [Rodentolepis nana]|uniref:Chromosome 1 open reading frame 52 n=1 Tax=Rodentolepis nana TaxID=102285 RepID=A0A0R3TWV4_RODNA|nr:unnamed protein product [Rodentolepis nana]